MTPQERIDKYLDVVEGMFNKGGEFVAAEMPLLCQEIISCHFWGAIWCGSMFLLVAFALWFLAFLFCKQASVEECSTDKDLGSAVGFGFFFLGFLFFAIALTYSKDVVKAVAAPRVILVEEVRRLVR